MKIQFEIDDEKAEALRAIFTELTGHKADEDVTLFAQLSVQIMQDWIMGSKRYRSLTEQYIEWVESIYLKMLPADTSPKYDVLYNNFNMSAGQATYISRVLLDKNLVHWRKLAKDELLRIFTEKLAKATDLKKGGNTEVSIDINISKLATNELKRISDQIRAGDDKFEMPISKGKDFGSYNYFSVPVDSFITIHENLSKHG